MEIDLFLGRFHPLVVHLPIGFIILAILLELANIKLKDKEKLSTAVKLSLLASVFASIVTVASGLFLENGGSYNPEILGQHKWLGFGVIALSLGGYLYKSKVTQINWKTSLIGSGILLLTISLTGHLGGNLTHGEDYLTEYAPTFVKKIANSKSADQTNPITALHPDSVILYRDIISPILGQKCIVCHNSENTLGKLDMELHSNLFKKAAQGTPIVPNNISKSELFKRVTLSVSNRKFMPPSGKALSYTETQIIKYWILQGADSLAKFDYETMPEELVSLMIRDYSIDFSPRPYYEKIQAPKLDSTLIEKLVQNNFSAKFLNEKSQLLDIRFSGKNISQDDLNTLTEVAENVTFLNLSNCNLSDDLKLDWEKFPHLTKLVLNSNAISNAFIENVGSLKNVEVVNVFDTQVTDESLLKILAMPSLKRVYVWKTQVTKQAIADARNQFPNIQIEEGYF